MSVFRIEGPQYTVCFTETCSQLIINAASASAVSR